MKIPKIQEGIISSVVVDMVGPQKDPNWANNMYTTLQIENPVIAEYLKQIREKYGEHATLVGLLMYRFIESQMEANELEDLFA